MKKLKSGSQMEKKDNGYTRTESTLDNGNRQFCALERFLETALCVYKRVKRHPQTTKRVYSHLCNDGTS